MVSGEVRAKDKVRVDGFPTEAQIAKGVHTHPEQLQGQLLAAGSEILPTMEEGHVVRIFMEHAKDFLGKRGTTTMVDTNDDFYARAAHFEEHKFLTPIAKTVKNATGILIPDPTALILPKHTVLVLQDERNAPFALCLRQGNSPFTTYGIFSSRPLFAGDEPELIEDGVKFYPWLRFAETDANHLEHRTIMAYSNETKSYVPMWRAVPARHVKKNMRDMYPTKLGEMKITTEEGTVLGYMIKAAKKVEADSIGWHVTCGPGVDPAIMVCIAACMDDSLPDSKIALSKTPNAWA